MANQYKMKGVTGGIRNTQKDTQKKDGYQKQAGIRAGSRIREVVLANNMAYLWTLTYADEETRRDVVQLDFRQFMRRLRYKLNEKIPFVAVIEIQKERAKKCGKDVLHLHFATDRRINISWLEEAWGHGFVEVEKFSGDVCRVAGYMSKYIKKDLEASGRREDENRYMVSRGLKEADRQTLVMSDEDFKYWRSKAEYDKEFEQGVWLKLNARARENEKVAIHLIREQGKDKITKIVS